LLKAGFIEVGPADPEDVGGEPGTWYQLDLHSDAHVMLRRDGEYPAE
jgi:ribosomal-protein-alanine N-acetyltransferase